MTTSPSADLAPIGSVEQLVERLRGGGKPRDKWMLGVEQERPVVHPNGTPAAVGEVMGEAGLLERLVPLGYEERRTGGQLFELRRGGARLTLEPGGQVEVAAAPQTTAAACRARLVEHARALEAAGDPVDLRFLGVGLYPWGSVDDLGWLPKPRYVLMRHYLPRKGRLAADMMKRTATVQVNLDFDDEATAVDKFRTAMGVTSIVTAMFAASPISDGRPNGYQSYRAAIWLETDPDRCGLLPFAFRDGCGLRDYVEWALDVPMFFVQRDGHFHDAGGMTFRRFLLEGWRQTHATTSDWDLHLSTLFPEVRMRPYIEVRGADAGPLAMAAALPALWRGLLDADDARRAAYALVRDWPFEERERVRREVPRGGLRVRCGARTLGELALELCRIAAAGLASLPGGPEDAALLGPLLDHVARGRTVADDMLDDFAAASGAPDALVERWRLRPPTADAAAAPAP